MDSAGLPPAAPAWRPDREVEIVAGTPAGGGQDRPARALVKVLEQGALAGVPLRVVNIPGAGGGNAWRYLTGHAGDAHRVAISSPTLITNALLGEDALDEQSLTPLANLYTEYIAFLVPASSGGDARDFAARLARTPDRMPIALATARGNVNHIALARVMRQAGGRPRDLDLQIFDSARDAVAAMLQGESAAAVVTAISAAAEVRSGALRALAVSAPSRLAPPFESVPTWTELGVPCILGTWRGVVGPPELPPAAVSFWEGALAAAAATAQWNEELRQQCWFNTFLDSAATRAFLREEHTTMRDALSDIGMLSS